MAPVRLRWHPSAGYILNVGSDATDALPGRLTPTERDYLLALGETVRDIGNQAHQADKRDLWYRHNALQPSQPLLTLFAENSWAEFLGEERMKVEDPFWRNEEWSLRHLIYRHEHFVDDFVIEPELVVPLVFGARRGWAPPVEAIAPTDDTGAKRWEPAFEDDAAFERFTFPDYEPPNVDEAATQTIRDAVGDVFGDILSIRVACLTPRANLCDLFLLRGHDGWLMDMHDRPDAVHRFMDALTEWHLNDLRYLEEHHHLTLNNGASYTDSGGLGYCRELPAPDFDGQHVRARDLWGYGCAQELALVGPAQHKEFMLDYQVRLLDRFGLCAYGCCESLENKFDMLFDNLPRLRRVSVSPFCDVQVAAEKIGDRCIFSWKPHPATVVGDFDPDAVRTYVRYTLDVAKANGCLLEISLKDTITVDHQPDRLDTWARIAREEIERAG